MNWQDITNVINGITADIKAGGLENYLQAYKKTLPLQEEIIDMISGLLGSRNLAACPPEIAAQLEAACTACMAECSKPVTETGPEGFDFTKILAIVKAIADIIQMFKK